MPTPFRFHTALDYGSMRAAGNPYQATGGTPEQNLTRLGELYAQNHNASLGMQAGNERNITGGYESILDYAGNAQGRTQQRYGDLSRDVLGDLNAAGTTERQGIADRYAAQSGLSAQHMISSGLGNSTVQQAVQRGLLYDQTKANNDVMERVGNMKANYRSNLGLAGLNYEGQSIRDNTALGRDQLGFMERIDTGYPNPGAYDAVASRIGATRQQDLDREAMERAAAAARTAGNMPMAGPVTSGGGRGFFPPADSGGSGYSGQPMGGGGYANPSPRFGPPPGTIPAMGTTPGAFTMGGYAGAFGGQGQEAAGFSSGLGRYAGPTGEGFSGGFGGQPYDLAGEDMPYGEAPVAAMQPGGYQPYGSGQNYGSTFASPGSSYQSGDYGYAGGDLNFGSESSADFYFGE